MYLVLTYFHSISGPTIIFSFPEMVPKDLSNNIKSLFDVEIENPFFEFVLAKENIKIINLFFEIPSEWARGNTEMLMLSIITGKDMKSESFYEILRMASNKIMSQSNIYKSLYLDNFPSKKDSEIEEKYEELKGIVLKLLNEFEDKKKELLLMELVSSKGLTLHGAQSIFGDILVDIISCLLQKKQVVLCGDRDASTSLYNVINRIFLDIIPINDLLLIKDECVDNKSNTFILNTRFRLIENGVVSNEAHNSINRVLKEAIKINDNEAAIILIRQQISILLRVAELLEKILKKETPTRLILKEIQNHLKIKLKVDDLYAIRLILKAKNKEELSKKIIVSKFDNF